MTKITAKREKTISENYTEDRGREILRGDGFVRGLRKEWGIYKQEKVGR